MARPGFNINWIGTLSLRERIVFTWLGKLNGSRASVHEFHQHLAWYRGMAATFGTDTVDEIEQELRPLADVAELGNVLDRVTAKTGVLQSWRSLREGGFEFDYDQNTIKEDLELLVDGGFETLVSLVEQDPHPVVSSSPLDVHHFPTRDMTPPSLNDVAAFADLLRTRKRVVVHCLAGLGRTTTMIVGGLVLLGEKIEELEQEVAERRPSYKRSGAQWDFLRSLGTSR